MQYHRLIIKTLLNSIIKIYKLLETICQFLTDKPAQHLKNSSTEKIHIQKKFPFLFHIPRGKNKVQEEEVEKNWAARNERKGKKKRDFIFSIFVWRGGNLICWVACFSERDRNGKIAKYLSFYNQIKENENLIVKRIHKKNVEEFCVVWMKQ